MMPFRQAWGEARSLPRAFWLVFVATLVNRAGTMVLPFLVLYLTHGLGMSASRAGIIFAAWGGAALVAGPVMGRVSDFVPPLRLMQVLLAATGSILLVYPAAHGFTAILAVTVATAFANEGFRPVAASIIADLVPASRLKSAYAVSRVATNIGMGIGPAVGGWLADHDMKALFWVDGGSSLLAALVLFLGCRHSPQAAPKRRSLRPSSDGGRSLFSNPLLRVCFIATFPVAIVIFQHISAMPMFMVTNLELPAKTYGLMFTLNTGLIVLLEVPLNTALAHWSYRRTLTLGTFLLAIGFGGMAWVSGLSGIVVTVVLWTFGEMLVLPVLTAYVAQVAPESRRGEAMGYYNMIWSMALMVGPWLGVEVLSRFGPTVLWSLILLLGLVATAAMTRLREADDSPSAIPSPAQAGTE